MKKEERSRKQGTARRGPEENRRKAASRPFSDAILVLLLSICFLLPASHAAHAATIYFDPQETTVGTSTPFLVGVKMDSDAPANAMRIVIDIPEGMVVADASDGDSIINAWVERPHITDGGQLIFAGIVPGGYQGNGAILVTLKLQASRQGKQTLILDPSSRVYDADPDATPQDIASAPLDLMVVPGRDNIANSIPDADPPEPFVPELAELPGNGGSRWAVSFQAADKGSGIAGYAVAESWRDVPLADAAGLAGLPWKEAESPYTVSDQALTSFIYVRAADKAGNIRVEKLAPLHAGAWYARPQSYILMALGLFAVLYAIISRTSKRKESRRKNG